jgi:2-methylcitrate dehydratase
MLRVRAENDPDVRHLGESAAPRCRSLLTIEMLTSRFMELKTSSLAATIRSRMISRRDILGGIAAFVPLVAVRNTRAAETRPLAERLAEYVLALRYEDLDEATIERVKLHVIDTVGCGIAAFDERPVRVCREIAQGTQGDATIFGTSRKTTADLAAFANGAAFRYYDLNDFYNGTTTTHPSDHIAPCLAVGEAVRAGGRDLITAIVVAYEINCRLVDDLDISQHGWDTPVYSLPAVALASGKLMGLDAAAMTEAVNIAINDHISMGQTRRQVLSDWKGLADSEASRNAVFAAILARGGLTGPAPIFEGTLGFFKQVSGEAPVDIGTFGGHGNSFRIHRCGIKTFPAVIFSQTAIVAALAVADEIAKGAPDKFTALERVASIEVATSRLGLKQTGTDREKWAPTTRDTADHSMPYLVARAMFDGDITNESYIPKKLEEPRILAFMQKITVVEDPAFTARAGDPPTRISATFGDGRRVSREIIDIPGFAGKPMQRPDVERKFRNNIGKRWQLEKTDAVLQSLWALEFKRDISALLRGLTV